jgi:hypothetical protein
MPSCAEPGCNRLAKARGLCGTHYAYRRRHGTLPLLVLKSASGCDFPGCQKPYEAHGLCTTHLRRLQKTGTLKTPIRSLPPTERFWIKVDRSGGPEACWPWLASIRGNNGYGGVWWKGKTCLAHRVAWELTNGPIPEGLTLDHLCRDRACCNPRHLEPVTHQVNILRGDAPSAVVARTKVCKRGHPQTPENVYIHQKRGRRHCKVCQRDRERSWRANADKYRAEGMG